MAMGRRRQSNLNLPPRMHIKSGTYYYVTSTSPRQWIKLSTDLSKAKALWAKLDNEASAKGSFEELSERYMDECLSDKSENWQKNAKSMASRLVKVFGNMQITDIKPTDIAQFLDHHYSKSSANNQIVLMGSMYEKAMRWGLCETNPCKGIRKHSMKARERYITDDEFSAVREAGNDLVRVVMDIAYLTGLRIIDVLKISLTDIKPDGLYIQQMKTGKKQVYNLTPDLSDAIARAKKLSASGVASLFLFSTRIGKQLSKATFYYHWDKARTSAGVEDCHFHDIRAKAGTDAKENGEDHQALLGHASRAMSDRYVKRRESQRVNPLSTKNNCRSSTK